MTRTNEAPASASQDLPTQCDVCGAGPPVVNGGVCGACRRVIPAQPLEPLEDRLERDAERNEELERAGVEGDPAAEEFDQELEAKGEISPGPAPTEAAELIEADLGEIDRSHNYRKTFPAAKMEELTASIAAKGVVQPIVLRPNAAHADGAPLALPWILVIGERRVRASIAAGRKTIPAMVRRDLDEVAARELSIIENLQREDVDPLEEADGFRELHEELGQPVEKIAASVGQKKGYVYARLKLCSLGADGRKAYRDGEIDVSVAVLVARIPAKDQQASAVSDVIGLSYEQAARIVHERYMLRLTGAPFDVTDAELVPAAGSCTKCPKRTGNQRELFPDVKSADVCTDPACFKKKADAAWVVTAAAAEKKGQKVIDGKSAAALFPYSGRLVHTAPFVDIEDECYSDPKNRPYKKLIGKDAPLTIARDPQGKVHLLLAKADLPHVVKGTAAKELAKLERSAAAVDGAAKAQKRKLERKRDVVRAILGELADKAKPETETIRALIRALAHQGFSNAVSDVVKRRGWTLGKDKRAAVVFNDGVSKLKTAGELFGLLAELVVTRDAYWSYAAGIPESVVRVATAAGVNTKAVEARVAAAKEAEKKKGKKVADEVLARSRKKGGKK